MQRVTILNSINQVIPAIGAGLVAVAKCAHRNLTGKDRLSWKWLGDDFLRCPWDTTRERMTSGTGGMCSHGYGHYGRHGFARLVPCPVVSPPAGLPNSRPATALS